ncbi:MAG TPA: sigma-70 family RNA polymerase sigma factor [Polyangiaceae bacterium]|nr:sigma-70 family RNA polymerase sigma factor [Polyangiaceae bacterium]
MDIESTGGERTGLPSGMRPDSPEALARFHQELDLVDLIARQVTKSIGRAIEFDDLLSAGREGLLDAARRFNAGRGVPFRAYANVRVYGAMIDGVRRISALPRRAHERLAALEAANQLAEGGLQLTFGNKTMTPGEADSAFAEELALMAAGCALSELGQVDGNPDGAAEVDHDTPEEQLSRAELLARVEQVLAGFEEVEEAAILRLVYFDGMTIEAAAREVDLNRGWASRLHTRGLDRLIKRMRKIV